MKLFGVFAIKRQLAVHESKKDHSKTPNVYLMRIRLLEKNLRGYVPLSSGLFGQVMLSWIHFLREAEISKHNTDRLLLLIEGAHKNVFKLEISMNDSHIFEMLQAFGEF